VASVAPSGRRLALALCRHIDPERPQTILELGAGTGAVTTAALERMHPDSVLFAIEMDSDFADILRNRCPQAQVIEADAAATADLLCERSIDQVDVIISGLPVPSLPWSVNHALFSCVGQFAGTDGVFSQITVMPWVYLNLYRGVFEHVAFTPVWRNIPCGGVYHCRGLREDFSAALPGKIAAAS